MSKMNYEQEVRWNKKEKRLEKIAKLNLKHKQLNNCIEFYFDGNNDK